MKLRGNCGIRTKVLRTEGPGSKGDKVDKSPWMNLTTGTKKLNEFYN